MSETNNIKLVINISHSRPISLADVSTGLNSVGNLYNNFTKDDERAQLFINEIKKGSIIIDLITTSAASILPLLSGTNNIVSFVYYIQLLVAKCSKKDTTELEDRTKGLYLPEPSIKDIKTFDKSLKIVSAKNDSVVIIAKDNSTIYNQCTINGADASNMQENIPALINDTSTHMYEMYKKVVFKWEQTNHSNSKRGNKALIEKLDRKPLKVIFENDSLKTEMTTSSDGTDWDKKFYIVDVEMNRSEGKPILYKIINNYMEDSFPIAEV